MIKLNSFFKGNKIIPITVLSGIFLGATFFGFPKLSSVFKPVVGRFNETNLGVITDSESGEIFSFIESDTGEKRFVKLDKTPEREVRNINRKISNLKEEISSLKAENKSLNQVLLSLKNRIPGDLDCSVDVRSGRICEITQNFQEFLINTRIKYRSKEKKMLYRVQIAMNPENVLIINDKEKYSCISDNQLKTMESLYKNKEEVSTLSLRFEDVDKFWILDTKVPLSESKGSNNGRSTVIDTIDNKNCSNPDAIVFHGKFKDFRLPDYEWVDNGKLLFQGIKFQKI